MKLISGFFYVFNIFFFFKSIQLIQHRASDDAVKNRIFETKYVCVAISLAAKTN